MTTTRDTWKAEIEIMKNVVSSLCDANGQIIFEYDIPRLGKRIDVVLLYAATEIQVQGLELDYTCVLWDADMRCDNGKWRYYTFNGKTAWNEKIPDTENKQEQIKYA